MPQHFVNISGGKESTACYLLALRRGRPFRAIMADTGHEHPATVEYAERLSELLVGVEWPRADAVFRWANTGRGGRQFDLLAWGNGDEGLSCSSQYGLCE